METSNERHKSSERAVTAYYSSRLLSVEMINWTSAISAYNERENERWWLKAAKLIHCDGNNNDISDTDDKLLLLLLLWRQSCVDNDVMQAAVDSRLMAGPLMAASRLKLPSSTWLRSWAISLDVTRRHKHWLWCITLLYVELSARWHRESSRE